MKIYQFTPLAPANKETPAEKTVPQSRGRDGDFASFLKAASPGAGGAEAAAGNPGGMVSLENRRALSLPSSVDVGAAGKLLRRLETAIKSASMETLEKVHNLEGLLYIHNKNIPS